MRTTPVGSAHVSALAALLAFVVSSSTAVPAMACNACVEDKIAATYDWQVASDARARGHTVVFAALLGPVNPGDDALARAIARRLGAVPGVDAGTVRVSVAPPAASFACDPVRTPPARLIAVMNRDLRSSRRSLVIIRVGVPGSSAPTPGATSNRRGAEKLDP